MKIKVKHAIPAQQRKWITWKKFSTFFWLIWIFNLLDNNFFIFLSMNTFMFLLYLIFYIFFFSSWKPTKGRELILFLSTLSGWGQRRMLLNSFNMTLHFQWRYKSLLEAWLSSLHSSKFPVSVLLWRRSDEWMSVQENTQVSYSTWTRFGENKHHGWHKFVPGKKHRKTPLASLPQ